MKTDVFEAGLKRHNLTSERFAEMFDVKSPTTVDNWRRGVVDVPGWASAVIELLDARPELMQWFAARRPHIGKAAARKRERRRLGKPDLRMAA